MKSLLSLLLFFAALSHAMAVPARQADARYVCTTDSDCVVVNHGNCCGATEVCALASATFTRSEICPASNGEVSVCGFESIEACACRQGVCYGMHGGEVSSSPKEWAV
ncbi:hypothetical protein I7I53_02953 [Histoplasma capsulatum var. duboisii H88]|uniref:Uncharacterized protein n=1 Tax=Ajellomyces capsulatus (strain H88) TaxID=544711 RepID=A0A8A1LP09_AJEC8|nr:hypothetical protein I7I53_02953 [Histoplasma capsulatum var. duboisii H88]